MKRIIYAFLLVISVMGITGCGNSNTELADNKILITYSQEKGNDYRDILAQKAQEIAEQEGAAVDIVYAEDSIEKQVQQIKDAAASNYSAIICVAEETDSVRQLITAADGIPIVFVNNKPDDNVLVADQYIYVGSDETLAGTYQAEYVLSQFESASEINVMLLKGTKEHSAAQERSKAVKETLLKSGKTINFLFDDYADYSTDRAKEYANVFMKTGNHIDCLIANNDNMALGALSAFEENGVDISDIVAVGIDATEEGCQAIIDGKMDFTVLQSAIKQGEYAALSAMKLGVGNSIAENEYAVDAGTKIFVPYEQVTMANVSDYID